MNEKIFSLDEIGKKYGTDKSSIHHNYLNNYENFMKEYKKQKITLIEFGIYQGSSLKMWEEYFNNGNIVGIDINQKNISYKDFSNRVNIYIGDMRSISFINEIFCKHKSPQFIIDDASHMCKDQIFLFENLFEYLNFNGYYIIEDVFVCNMEQYSMNNNYTILDYIKQYIEYFVANKQSKNNKINDICKKIQYIKFINKSIIIRKI